MNPTRFIHFTQMVDTTQKCVRRLELAFAPLFSVKGVHIFWLYELQQNPEGLTASELANRRMVDRSLISRELDALKKEGLVEAKTNEGRSYNARLTLTDKGREVAEKIGEVALSIQNEVSCDISQRELLSFYVTFEKIRDKLIDITANINTDTPQTIKEGSKT